MSLCILFTKGGESLRGCHGRSRLMVTDKIRVVASRTGALSVKRSIYLVPIQPDDPSAG